MNLHTKCRLCLCDNPKNPVHALQHPNVLNAIKILCQIVIKANDDVDLICAECIKVLNTLKSYHRNQKLINEDRRLKSTAVITQQTIQVDTLKRKGKLTEESHDLNNVQPSGKPVRVVTNYGSTISPVKVLLKKSKSPLNAKNQILEKTKLRKCKVLLRRITINDVVPALHNASELEKTDACFTPIKITKTTSNIITSTPFIRTTPTIATTSVKKTTTKPNRLINPLLTKPLPLTEDAFKKPCNQPRKELIDAQTIEQRCKNVQAVINETKAKNSNMMAKLAVNVAVVNPNNSKATTPTTAAVPLSAVCFRCKSSLFHICIMKHGKIVSHTDFNANELEYLCGSLKMLLRDKVTMRKIIKSCKPAEETVKLLQELGIDDMLQHLID